MDEKMEISPDGLLKRFSHQTDFKAETVKLSTPQLSDALKNLINYIPVIQGVKPLKEDFKILGKAITVKTSADDWGTVLKAMDQAHEGDVLFISADRDDSAVWGELTSKSAQQKKIAGTVVYGAVRDVNAIRKLN
ncbi:MAG: RraA family protein, partial [Methanobacterium sp.]|nr:RraA family protein [Methanobacterium sp.]